MWATDYVDQLAEQMVPSVKVANVGSMTVQGLNAASRARGHTVPLPVVSGAHALWGATPLLAGGALIGAAGHGSGQDDVKKNLEDAGSTPAEIAKADYLAGHPKEGYGLGNAIGSGVVGMGTGLVTNLATQRALGVSPTMGRGIGLAAGLGAAYLHSRHSAEGEERARLKGAS